MRIYHAFVAASGAGLCACAARDAQLAQQGEQLVASLACRGLFPLLVGEGIGQRLKLRMYLRIVCVWLVGTRVKGRARFDACPRVRVSWEEPARSRRG